MDLEHIFQNAGSMDAQNVTILLLGVLAQFGSNKTSLRPAATSVDDELETNQTTVEDDVVLLALNLSAMLMKYYSNNSALWNAVVANLEKEEIRRKEEDNRLLSPTTSITLISVYMVVITIGTLGNLLVITAATRQPSLRSRGNAFIINLAVSDLLLCLVTMPLTLIELLNDHWLLGDSVLSCKAAGGLQALSVFVSTITIAAIALDRYQLIVYPTKDVLKRIGAVAGIFLIWIMGICLASPVFIFRTLEHYDLDYPTKGSEINTGKGAHSIDYCYEKWPVPNGQTIYSAFTLLVQYALPILIISVLHTQICQRLRLRHSKMESMSSQNAHRKMEERKRLRRRHRLLMAISLIFSITWLPLNVLNLTLDLFNPFKLPRDQEMVNIICATCHLFGMSSACANPFLYGWFNENFRGEFKLILAAPCRLFCPTRGASDANEIRLRHCNSPATACTSVPIDSMSTLGQNKLRRIATTQFTIDTSIDETNKMIKKNSTIEFGQPMSTTKETIVMVDRQNVVETNLISPSISSGSQAEGRVDSNIFCPAHSDEIEDGIIFMHPILSSIVGQPSNILETHL